MSDLRESFDRELLMLQNDVLALGDMVSGMLQKSVHCLKTRDFHGSEEVIAYDQVVNKKRFKIEEDVLALIALRQPIAVDLRMLSAMLEFAIELERMGDYGKGIARINLMIGEKPLLKPLVDIPLMSDQVREMLNQVLTAFIRHDAELARRIPAMDDEVDRLYNLVYRELAEHIIADPNVLDQANYLLWAAHNLERAGDRVLNLCERVVFTVTGELEELN
ncbi:MAG: phosphate signaling complex protein PhoU [Anaerolineaceae bacterium]|nr:phosphate signaling complex protein PhoU [Anaerolineaceae bacterium]